MTSSFTSELCVTCRGRAAGCRQRSPSADWVTGCQLALTSDNATAQTLITTTNEKWCSSLPFNPFWQLLIVGSYGCVEPLLNLSCMNAFNNALRKKPNPSNVNSKHFIYDYDKTTRKTLILNKLTTNYWCC